MNHHTEEFIIKQPDRITVGIYVSYAAQ